MTLVELAPALPWIALPVILLWRQRASRSLDDEAASAPADAPLVSIVIPARDEARNIARCLSSVLATSYPRIEVIVVDDHSADATHALAESVASRDARARVLTNPDLPDGWFGKQWACTTGAGAARGEILLFADADTEHAPDLVTRAVNAMRSREADLLSIAGRQELGSFWERVVQPLVFALLALRYGSTERVTTSPHITDKIANGQCLLIRRDAYDAIGGHAAVRQVVAEDLALAQRTFAHGRRVALVLGVDQLSTRMYTSLREIVRGWRKNIFVGGISSVPGGALGRFFYPALLLFTPIVPLIPVVTLTLGLLGLVSAATLAWSAIAVAVTLAFWMLVYHRIGESPLYGFAYPLGSLVLLGIALQAVTRGQDVTWKGRSYVSH